jgi:hypothetical protein
MERKRKRWNSKTRMPLWKEREMRIGTIRMTTIQKPWLSWDSQEHALTAKPHKIYDDGDDDDESDDKMVYCSII